MGRGQPSQAGPVRFRWTKDLPGVTKGSPQGRITGARLVKDALGWHIVFRTEALVPEPAQHSGPQVGMDVGVSVPLALSDGSMLEHDDWLNEKERAKLLRWQLQREAIRYVAELGALGEGVLLNCRLAGVLMEMGEGEHGERILRDILAEERRVNAEALSYVRIQLGLRCGSTGRTEEARFHLELLTEEFAHRALALFQGLVEGLLGWLDILDGLPAEALPRALAKSLEPMARLVAPQMAPAQLLSGARAWALLAGEDGQDDREDDGKDRAARFRLAARLIGAYDALRPPSSGKPAMERESREWTEAAARAALGDAGYQSAYAEGGGLSLEEATALV
ncbi:hypothetical protein [Streptomyces sp. H27-D2]|uniref:hypothetical protein n=1 Tax=Streptomyces sp. H27-D2 TaxID=3046304 RepID=UPI002DBA2C0E|nr:hypothetical protein [Streptomyces sp. H27-D2]MEC4017854.1 hypothetical protein [Streptomyces sp. H27-D2]